MPNPYTDTAGEQGDFQIRLGSVDASVLDNDLQVSCTPSETAVYPKNEFGGVLYLLREHITASFHFDR